MQHDSKLTASPRPLKFADGTEYRMSPLNDRDIGELDEWVRAVYIRTAEAAIPKTASSSERQDRIARATMDAMELSFMTGVGAKLIASVPGMAKLCWQSIHSNHPEVTEEALSAKLFDPINLAKLNETFKSLNGGSRKGQPPKGKGSSPARKR